MGLFFSFTSPVSAKLNVNVSPGWISGFNTYQIGGTFNRANGSSIDYHFPLSELKFPVEGMSGKLDVNWAPSSRIKFSSSYLQFLTTGSVGFMKDRDWGVGYINGAPNSSPSTLSIYSKSASHLKHYQLDFMALFRPFKAIPIDIGSGYRRINFRYNIKDAQQYHLSSYTQFKFGNAQVNVPGTVLTYEANYYLPLFYVQVANHIINNIHAKLLLGYTPLATVKDKDDHVLRSKLSTGKATGTAFLSELEVKVPIKHNWSYTFQAHYFFIHTNGTQVQTQYETILDGNIISALEGPIGTIDQKIYGEQWQLVTSLSYDF